MNIIYKNVLSISSTSYLMITTSRKIEDIRKLAMMMHATCEYR